MSYTYHWQRCNAISHACSDIALATSPSYTLTHSDVGETIRVLVSASNPAGSTRAYSAQTQVVEALPPHNLQAPTVTGEPRVGKPLHAGVGTWEGSAPISYSYHWESCLGATCAPIERATLSTYTPTAGEVGDELRVAVTARNAAPPEASAVSARTGTVLPLGQGEKEYTLASTTSCVTAPGVLNETGGGSVIVNSIGPAEATAGAGLDLTAATSTITLPVGLTNWLPAIGVTQIRGALKGMPLDFTGLETPTLNFATLEGFGEGRPYSAGIIAGQAPIVYIPESGSALIGPDQVVGKAGEEVSMHLDSSAGNGIRLTLSGYTSSGEHVIGPLEVACTVGTSSAQIPIGALPANTAKPSVGGTAEDEQTLTATKGTWTGSEPLSYAYQWQRCVGTSCENITSQGGTAADYPVKHDDVGHTLKVIVTATNALGSALATSLATAPVAPAAPHNSAPPAVSGVAEEGVTLTASTGSWSGTPPFTYAYQWERCNERGEACEGIEGAEGPSYRQGAEDAGHTIRVGVRASNSAGSTAEGWRAPTTLLSGAGWSENPPALASDDATGEVVAAWSEGQPVERSGESEPFPFGSKIDASVDSGVIGRAQLRYLAQVTLVMNG